MSNKYYKELKERRERLKVRKAECCLHCKNTGADFTFSDAVMCFKTNDYQMHTDVCDEFKEREQ